MTTIFRNSLATLCMTLGALMLSANLSAAEPAGQDECTKELLLSYFPESMVNDTLKRFNIAQDKWAGIAKSLSSKDKDVVKLVEQKAAAMNPNPLKDPQQRQAAVKLFRETLLQVFSDAMRENGIQDASQFQAMLDDIQQQKAKRFAMCMEKQKAQLQKQQSSMNANAPKSSDEEKDEDEEETEDDEDEEGDEEESKGNITKPASPNLNIQIKK